MKNVNLVILNITSWAGLCSDATHVYGKLILCDQPKVTMDNIEEWGVNTVGENIELRQPLTLELAKKLDAKDGGKTYQRAFHLHADFKDDPDFYDLFNTMRFETFEEVENFAIAKWRELNLNCPFISLYEGDKYDFDYNGQQGKTKVLYK